MKIVVLDTNVLIDNVNGFAPWVNILLKAPQKARLIIPTIVIAEYLTAQEVERAPERAKTEEYLSLFLKQDLTEEIADVLGTILRRKTYQKGAGLGDLIIAATAIYLKGELATRNREDFAKIPDLAFFEPKKLPYD